MKTITTILTALILTLSAAPVQAGTYYLEPNGQAVLIGGHTVVCGGGGAPVQETKFQCACFAPDGRGTNLGMVWGVWANGQRDAEYRAKHKCMQQYRQQIGSVSCFPQSF